jgi:hypothetical protein
MLTESDIIYELICPSYNLHFNTHWILLDKYEYNVFVDTISPLTAGYYPARISYEIQVVSYKGKHR